MISILLCDFYKAIHKDLYDPSITKLVAYYTPRKSRIEGVDAIPVIGIQMFIKEYLIKHFNENFFKVPLIDVLKQYIDIITSTLGSDRLSIDKIIALHNLGYLPLEINSIEEGEKIPMGCPAIEITNTHPNFAWVVNAIESLMSAELWYQSCTAIAGMKYREIVNKYFEQTVDNWLVKARSAISEFGFRGLPGLEAACKASMGFLLSFNKTATIPAIEKIRRYYGDTMSSIGSGMASTEHSIMTSSAALDGNEIDFYKRLFTKIYPTGNISVVCDSYDYWNIIDNIVPTLKKEILARKGTVFFRGDSGDPVEIVTETVFGLWDTFGGTVNDKGYRVLSPSVRAIYGDAITQVRAKEIYKILEDRGFSAENVVLGAGSFSMLCLMDENGSLNPYSRDSFSIAVKTVEGETEEKSFHIFKDPKTDTDMFKKSQKGCCIVSSAIDGTLTYEDGYDYKTARKTEYNLLKPLFKDGRLLRETTFNEIRDRFWNEMF